MQTSKDGRKVLFGGREAEGTTTDVVGTGFGVHPYILEGVCCTTNDEVFAQYPSCFVNEVNEYAPDNMEGNANTVKLRAPQDYNIIRDRKF